MSVEILHILFAHARTNGITIQSPKYSFLNIVTTRDNNGVIHSDIFPAFDSKLDLLGAFTCKENFDFKRIRKQTLITNIFLLLIAFLLTWKTLNIGFILAATFWVIFASKDFWAFTNVAFQMKSRHGSEHSTARYHSAEHMVVNAYNQFGRVPSIEEAKQFSRFSKHCGSQSTINHLILSITTCILCCIACKIPIAIYLPLLIIIQGFCILASKKGWFKFFQAFVTEEPTEDELEVAIHGILYMQDAEKDFTDFLLADFEEFADADYDDDDDI